MVIFNGKIHEHCNGKIHEHCNIIEHATHPTPIHGDAFDLGFALAGFFGHGTVFRPVSPNQYETFGDIILHI